jgi:hypothetical protein
MGIGSAYFGMGLANGLNQFTQNMREGEDRRRAQAKEDEIMQMKRDEIAGNLKQRAFENTLQTNQDTRAGAAAADQHGMVQHTMGRFGAEDAQHDAAFELNQKLGQGKVDMLPLERQRILAELGAARDTSQINALHQRLLGLNLQNEQMNTAKLHAVNDLEQAHIAAQSGNDPAPYADWFNSHAPPGQRVEFRPNAKGGYDAMHYAVGASNEGPPSIKLINTQHFPTLDAVGDEAQNLVHSDDLYKAQLHGLQSPNFISLRGDNNQPVIFDKRRARYMDASGQPWNGKLAPDSNSFMQQFANPGGQQYGMGNGQAPQQQNPGSSFISGAVPAQQRVQQTQPNTGFDVNRYLGDGFNGDQ